MESNLQNILLIGKNGQVGWELQRTLAPLGNLVVADRDDKNLPLDLADSDAIRTLVQEIRPALIVNAAAYTEVDKAEEEFDKAMAINGKAPGILAEEALKIGSALIHYSTDYVFDGTATTPYKETDTPNPVNAYGRSKLEGDKAEIRSAMMDRSAATVSRGRVCYRGACLYLNPAHHADSPVSGHSLTTPSPSRQPDPRWNLVRGSGRVP